MFIPFQRFHLHFEPRSHGHLTITLILNISINYYFIGLAFDASKQISVYPSDDEDDNAADSRNLIISTSPVDGSVTATEHDYSSAVILISETPAGSASSTGMRHTDFHSPPPPPDPVIPEPIAATVQGTNIHSLIKLRLN